MKEKQGYNLKAAIKLTDPYAKYCVDCFKSKKDIDFFRLINDAEPVDFNKENKTDYLVIRLSCLLINSKEDKVGIIYRSKEDHSQICDKNSILISSELIQPYTFVKVTGGLLINPYYPFTLKLGAYLSAFDIEMKPWFACLRRQPDYKTGKMRHYAFYVYIADLIDPEKLPNKFNLYGNIPHDRFIGFWPFEEALELISKEPGLEVDILALNSLRYNFYEDEDILCSGTTFYPLHSRNIKHPRLLTKEELDKFLQISGHEQVLTENFVVPLLESQGYTGVDFIRHQGGDQFREHGQDIKFWTCPSPLGRDMPIVAQVKDVIINEKNSAGILNSLKRALNYPIKKTNQSNYKIKPLFCMLITSKYFSGSAKDFLKESIENEFGRDSILFVDHIILKDWFFKFGIEKEYQNLIKKEL